MKRVLSAVCCISMMAIPVLAQGHHGKAAVNGKAPMTDQQFVDFAAQTDMVEAHLGKMAQDMSDSQPIKDYGQMLMTDHTSDYQQLKTAAQPLNLTVPNGIDSEHYKGMIAPFEKLKGTAFDHKFIAEMVSGHTKAIEIYKKEAENAENPAVKSYAQTALPVLEKHLEDAKDLQMGKAPSAQ